MSRRRAAAMLALALVSGWLAASDVRSRERRVSAGLGGFTTALVARSDVEAGKRVDGSDLELRRMPARFLPPDALRSGADALGLRAAVPIPRGAYVTASALAAPGASADNPPALAPGERAVDVTVSGTGAAELGGPGARVDVLVTTGRDGGAGRTRLALQDVQLLAVRQGPSQDSSDHLVATLRVTVRQAVYLTAAQNFAQEVRLLPRPPGDRGGLDRLSIGGGQL
jgi:pilus assembly protein CpaB